MSVDFLSASALEQDARVTHHGTGPEPLVLKRRNTGKQTVQGGRHAQGSASVQDVVDGIAGF